MYNLSDRDQYGKVATEMASEPSVLGLEYALCGGLWQYRVGWLGQLPMWQQPRKQLVWPSCSQRLARVRDKPSSLENPFVFSTHHKATCEHFLQTKLLMERDKSQGGDPPKMNHFLESSRHSYSLKCVQLLGWMEGVQNDKMADTSYCISATQKGEDFLRKVGWVVRK